MRMANQSKMNPGFITRAELAGRLGVTVYEIRRREASGRIHPAKRVGKTPLYTDNQAIEMQANKEFARSSYIIYSSEDAKRVFDMLYENKDQVSILRETSLHPLVVQAIAAAYAERGGALIVRKTVMVKINALVLDGNFPITNDDDLFDVLKACAEPKCTNCGKRPRVVCKHCVAALARKLDL